MTRQLDLWLGSRISDFSRAVQSMQLCWTLALLVQTWRSGLCQETWPQSLIHFASDEAEEKRREARDEIRKEHDEFHQELEEKRKRLDKELQDQAEEEKGIEDEVQKIKKASEAAAKKALEKKSEKTSKDQAVMLLEWNDVQVTWLFASLVFLGCVLLIFTRRTASNVELGDYIRQDDLVQVA
mmetsp:Transcript_51186/g.111485  ORF Transcript_51186/g.111485 Transcript_51186/m.111485 type:complete len:183 (-) Transcript_51186:47-595(-)